VAGTALQANETRALCVAGDNPGQWLWAPDHETGMTHQSWLDNWKWAADDCRYEKYTRATLADMLAEKGVHKLLLQGDSQTRVLWNTFNDFVFNTGDIAQLWHSDGSKCADLALSGGGTWHFCLMFQWRTSAQEQVFEVPVDVDFIFFNSGQHPAAYTCAAVFQTEMAAVSAWVTANKATTKLVWMTTKASANTLSEWVGKGENKQTPRRIEEVNGIGRAMAVHTGIPVVDSFSLTQDRLDQICDGTHFACTTMGLDCTMCSAAFMQKNKGHIHGPVVFQEVQILLNTIRSYEAGKKRPAKLAEAAAKTATAAVKSESGHDYHEKLLTNRVVVRNNLIEVAGGKNRICNSNYLLLPEATSVDLCEAGCRTFEACYLFSYAAGSINTAPWTNCRVSDKATQCVSGQKPDDWPETQLWQLADSSTVGTFGRLDVVLKVTRLTGVGNGHRLGRRRRQAPGASDPTGESTAPAPRRIPLPEINPIVRGKPAY
jgi:hypothetical protein